MSSVRKVPCVLFMGRKQMEHKQGNQSDLSWNACSTSDEQSALRSAWWPLDQGQDSLENEERRGREQNWHFPRCRGLTEGQELDEEIEPCPGMCPGGAPSFQVLWFLPVLCLGYHPGLRILFVSPDLAPGYASREINAVEPHVILHLTPFFLNQI